MSEIPHSQFSPERQDTSEFYTYQWNNNPTPYEDLEYKNRKDDDSSFIVGIENMTTVFQEISDILLRSGLNRLKAANKSSAETAGFTIEVEKDEDTNLPRIKMNSPQTKKNYILSLQDKEGKRQLCINSNKLDEDLQAGSFALQMLETAYYCLSEDLENKGLKVEGFKSHKQLKKELKGLRERNSEPNESS